MILLEAVNTVLTLNGTSPVNHVEPVPPTDHAVKAIRFIDMVSRQQQVGGFTHNTETPVTLSPGIDGKIVVPPGALTVRGVDADDGDIGVRGSYLVKVATGVQVFDASVRVVVTSWYDFACIPHHIQEYVVAEAALLMSQSIRVNVRGSSDARDRIGILVENRNRSLSDMQRIEADSSDIDPRQLASGLRMQGDMPVYGGQRW